MTTKCSQRLEQCWARGRSLFLNKSDARRHASSLQQIVKCRNTRARLYSLSPHKTKRHRGLTRIFLCACVRQISMRAVSVAHLNVTRSHHKTKTRVPAQNAEAHLRCDLPRCGQAPRFKFLHRLGQQDQRKFFLWRRHWYSSSGMITQKNHFVATLGSVA